MSDKTTYESLDNRIAPEALTEDHTKGLAVVDGHAVKSQEDYEDPNRLYDMLIARIRKYHPSTDVSMIEKAYKLAVKAHGDQRRKSGEPYIIHPLWVAIILADLEMDKETIAAGILHDVVEDTKFTEEDIRREFGDEVALLVDGVTKLGRLSYSSDKLEVQAENLRKMFLAMAKDIRVIIIKLADRLHNCRTIEYMPEHKRDKILSETMFIFIPLAHRLGLYSVKSEMENIWLMHKEPDTYREIYERINRDAATRAKDIDSFIAPIEEALSKAGFKFKIKKRIKTPYSIWYKMHTKHVPFEQIYDLYAVRIIFDPGDELPQTERSQAYLIFAAITSLYSENVNRRRDWIAHPKNNGYEALHCTLMSHAGVWVEVQIRSRRMDDIAEKGLQERRLHIRERLRDGQVAGTGPGHTLQQGCERTGAPGHHSPGPREQRDSGVHPTRRTEVHTQRCHCPGLRIPDPHPHRQQRHRGQGEYETRAPVPGAQGR